jgi:hypothetical protein
MKILYVLLPLFFTSVAYAEVAPQPQPKVEPSSATYKDIAPVKTAPHKCPKGADKKHCKGK